MPIALALAVADGAVRACRSAIADPRRACHVFRSRPHRAACRRRAQGGRGDGLFVGDDRRHARADRCVFQEIRREDAVLARELREHPAPRDDRAARRPLRRGCHRDQRCRNGSPAPRGRAAGGALAASAGHRAGSVAPAPRMGWRPPQHHRRRLQHQAGPQGRDPGYATRTSPIRAGRGGSASNPTMRSGSARSPMRSARTP